MNKTSIGPSRSRGRPYTCGRAPTDSGMLCREYCQTAIRGGPTCYAITSAVKRRWGDKQRNRDDTATSLQTKNGFDGFWWFKNAKLSIALVTYIAGDFHWPVNALPYIIWETSFDLDLRHLKKYIVSKTKARDWIMTTCAGGFSWKPVRDNETSTLKQQVNFSAARRAGIVMPANLIFETTPSITATKNPDIAKCRARDKIFTTCTGGQPWKPDRENQTKHQITRTSFFTARGLEYVLPFKLENNSTNINHFLILKK